MSAEGGNKENNNINNKEGKKTVSRRGRGEYTEKKSVFTGTAAPVSTRAEADEFVASVRAEFPDARHNVYAYVVSEGNSARYSDDGEPQGTGGMPVLDVIRKSGVTDTAIVVSRYFGGILLGAPGLVRAYTAAATAALQDAGIITLRRFALCTLTVDYSAYTRLDPSLDRFGVMRDKVDYGEKVSLSLALPAADFDALRAFVVESTSGKYAPELTGAEEFR